MPVNSLSLFNPFAVWSSFLGGSGKVTSTPAARGAAIAVKGESSDRGAKLAVGKNSVTISGTTRGSVQVGDSYYSYSSARGMSFTLDIDKASTTDSFGRTDYTEKNRRLFNLTTSPGWSAKKCAEMLAAKVNAGDDFSAKVTTHRDGSATIDFAHRA